MIKAGDVILIEKLPPGHKDKVWLTRPDDFIELTSTRLFAVHCSHPMLVLEECIDIGNFARVFVAGKVGLLERSWLLYASVVARRE